MKPLTLSKPHLLIMVGIPGSGKSFFAEHFSETFKAPYISVDKLRSELFIKPDFSKKEDAILSKVTNYMLEETFKTSQTILFEGLTDTKTERLNLARKARESGYEPLIIWVQTEPITAKKRALKQPAEKISLTPAQFDEQSKRFTQPSQNENYTVISGKHTYVSQLKIILKKIIKTQPADQPIIPINPIRPQVSRNILIR